MPPKCFVLLSSPGSLQLCLANIILVLKHSVSLRRNLLCGGVAACLCMACALCAVRNWTLRFVKQTLKHRFRIIMEQQQTLLFF